MTEINSSTTDKKPEQLNQPPVIVDRVQQPHTEDISKDDGSEEDGEPVDSIVDEDDENLYYTDIHGLTSTDKGSLAYTNSANPCVDLFFHTVRDLKQSELFRILEAAWKESPLDTLKILFHVRDCRGGKGERKLFYMGVFWLLTCHFDDYMINQQHIPFYGKWKDLWRIYGLFGNRKTVQTPNVLKYRQSILEMFAKQLTEDKKIMDDTNTKNKTISLCAKWAPSERTGKKRLLGVPTKKSMIEPECLSKMGTQKIGIEQPNPGKDEPDWKIVNIKISSCVKSAPVEKPGKKKVEKDKKQKYPLERTFHLVSGVCKVLGISKKTYRKEWITPLRKQLKIVETPMCSGKWTEINYNHVPSVAMKTHKKAFMKHDKDGFTKFKEDLKSGKTKVNTSVLEPHTIIEEYLRHIGEDVNIEPDDLLEKSWSNIVADLKKKIGNKDMTNSLAIADVSGSMINHKSPEAITVSITLGLIVAELCTNDAFDSKLLTFSEKPKWIPFAKDYTLREKISAIRFAEWGGTTNLEEVFLMILGTAVSKQLKQEQMIKRLYIISDMQFDEMRSHSHKSTSLDDIRAMYGRANYKMPTIIFWNVVANTHSIPAKAYDPNVSLVGGFSPKILSAIIEGDSEITPYKTMRWTLDAPRYDRIKLANPVDKPTVQPTEKPVDKPTVQPTEKPVEGNTDKTVKPV